jgi:hypothetical protein
VNDLRFITCAPEVRTLLSLVFVALRSVTNTVTKVTRVCGHDLTHTLGESKGTHRLDGKRTWWSNNLTNESVHVDMLLSMISCRDKPL